MPRTDIQAAVAEISQPASAPRKGAWRIRLEALLFTAGAQTGIQLLGVGTGLAIVRLLSVREYAYYTIANAAFGTMTVLSDSGVSQSAMAEGGRVWQNRPALGAIVAGGMMLRRRFAVAAVVISIPTLFLLLRKQGAGFAAAVLVTVSILPLFLSTITAQVLEVVPRLHQRLAPLQWIQLSGAGLRFVTAVGLVTLFPFAWLASLGAGIAQIWTTWRLGRVSGSLADLDAPPDRGATKEMTRQITRAAPGAVYYAFAGQITVWLISVFGSTTAVAQVGALGRLAMAFNVATAVFGAIVVPRFARAQFTGRSFALRRFWYTQVGMAAVLSGGVLLVAAFPSAVLLVLGRDYALLTHEVVLAAVGGALALLSGCAYAMAGARGVIIAPWLLVPVAILLQAALVAWLPMTTVSGVLWLGILSNLVFWLMHAANFTYGVALSR